MSESGNGVKNLRLIATLLAMALCGESGYIVRSVTTPSPYTVERGVIQQSLANLEASQQSTNAVVNTIKDKQIEQSAKLAEIEERLKLGKSQ